jgi:threonine dehydrogenase-like Zn-dependent dehydrogenase
VRALTVDPGDPGSAAVTEVPEPRADDGAVLVRGLLLGVCGTDREIVHGGYPGAADSDGPFVLGHESLGKVLEAPDRCGLRAGDRVVGVVRRPDPVPCSACAVGEWDMCRNGRYTERGIKGLPGFGSQRWRADERFLVRVDPDLGDAAVLMEPASVVAKAWEQAERIGTRAHFAPRRALVTGAGPVGLLAALLARQRGLDVTVADIVTDGPKPALVRDLGAAYVSEPVPELEEEFDVIVECTGVPSVVAATVHAAAPDAVVVLAGLSGGSEHSVDLGKVNDRIVGRNFVVVGTVNAALRHYEQAEAALRAADREWLHRLITRRVPMDRWHEALDAAPADVKVVVDLR